MLKGLQQLSPIPCQITSGSGAGGQLFLKTVLTDLPKELLTIEEILVKIDIIWLGFRTKKR